MKIPKMPTKVQPGDHMMVVMGLPRGVRATTPKGYKRIRRGVFLRKVGRSFERVGKKK